MKRIHGIEQSDFIENRFAEHDPHSKNSPLEDIQEWMGQSLPCIAGRREFNRGRYLIQMACKQSIVQLFDAYKLKLQSGTATACLFVFDNWDFDFSNADTSRVFYFLADQMSPISSLPAESLANGQALTLSIRLDCPITNKVTSFDDFECIAFCPQSNNRSDPLYDPLLAMPYPCVNLSSDVYAFSRFVADSIETMFGKPAYEVEDLDALEQAFGVCVLRWHRVACATIENYESLTDTKLCPVHVTKDNKHWVAWHKDPAFAEQTKEAHQHELPVLYGARITSNWMAFFRGERRYDAGGLARAGIAVNL